MSDATLNSVTQDPGDFAVQIADQIKTFIVAVTEVSKVEEPEEAVPVLLLQVSQLLLAGGLARRVRGRPARRALRAGPRRGARRGRPARAVRGAAGADRRLLRGLRPVRAPQGPGPAPDLRRPGRPGHRPRPRPGALRGRPHRRGAVVVAVLVLLQLGLHRLRHPARPPVPGRPHPPGPAPRGTGRPGHRPGPGRRRPRGRGGPRDAPGDRGAAGAAPGAVAGRRCAPRGPGGARGASRVVRRPCLGPV